MAIIAFASDVIGEQLGHLLWLKEPHTLHLLCGEVIEGKITQFPSKPYPLGHVETLLLAP